VFSKKKEKEKEISESILSLFSLSQTNSYSSNELYEKKWN